MWKRIMNDMFECYGCNHQALLKDMSWVPLKKSYICSQCGQGIHNITVVDDIPEEQLQEIRKRIKDLDCKKRYVIYSTILDKKHYYNIEDSTFCDNLDYATKFKRKKHAILIAITLEQKNSKEAQAPDESCAVSVDRTSWLDDVFHRFKNGTILLPSNSYHLECIEVER